MHRRSSSTGAVVHSPQPFGVPRVATATTKYYAQGPPQHPARPLGNAMTVPAQPHLSLPPVTYTDSSPPAALFTPDSRMRVVDMKQPDQLSNTLHLVAPPVTPQQYHVVHPMGVPSYASPATLPRYQLHDPGYGSPPAAPKIKPGLPTDYSPPTVHSAVPTSHVSNGSASSGASTHASSLPSPYAFRLEETGKTVYPGRASSQTSDYDGKRPRHPGFNLPSETKEMLTRERLPSVRFARRNAEHSGIELMDALTGVNMHEQGSYTLREMHAEDRDKIDLAITVSFHPSNKEDIIANYVLSVARASQYNLCCANRWRRRSSRPYRIGSTHCTRSRPFLGCMSLYYRPYGYHSNSLGRLETFL